MNITLYPYRRLWFGPWMFDDHKHDIQKELFVSGIPEMIDWLTEEIPGARKGFELKVSDKPMKGYQIELQKVRNEDGGAWYYSPQTEDEGWLCPVLLTYFQKPPRRLYAKARGLV